MNKLPVFRTFGHAVGFTFANFFTIFRLAWLPFAALLIAMFALGLFAADIMTAGPLGKPMVDPFTIGEHIAQFVFLEVTLILLQAIVIAAVAVSVHRVILFGDRRPGAYFNFAFGKTEFLYLTMGVLTAFIVIAIMGAVLTPAVFLAAHGDFAAFFARFEDWPANMPDLAASGALAPIMVAYSLGWLLVVYFMLRLAVWPPAVVATGRLSPAEAWRLTHGNVWRLIALFLLVSITLWLVVGLPVAAYWYQLATHAGPMIQPGALAPEALQHASDPAAVRELMRQAMDRQMQALQPYAPLFWFCYLLFYVFVTGLSVALISYSYKALKGYDAKEPIPLEG